MLADAESQLRVVRTMYRKGVSKDAEEPPAALKARIKNVLENQRSALEYLAKQLFANYGDGSSIQVYYPVADQPEQFNGIFNKFLPGVADKCPEVRDAMEARQGYQEGYEWFTHLVRLTNENKHEGLTRQMRVEMPVVEIEDKNGKLMTVHGAVYVAETATTTAIKDLGFRHDWFFRDPPVPARVTLIKIQTELPRLIDDVLAALP
jgi:hypothetical protein